jgi:GT2 family glycosyltransferase
LNDAEDYEFGLRARESGITIVVNNQLLGMHNDPVNCRQFILRNRQYALANEKLVNEGTVKGSQYARQQPLWYKKMIFFFLSAKLWLNSIDGNFFVWLYQPWRYKFYEYVTAAFIYYYPGKKI